MKKPLIERSCTNRGFVLGEFTDLYGTKCSIQESSLADEPAIWLGVSKADVKVMSVDANNLPLPRIVPEEGSGETYGWSDYILPDEVNVFSRMHLSIDMAKELVNELQHFIKTGELPRDGIKNAGE